MISGRIATLRLYIVICSTNITSAVLDRKEHLYTSLQSSRHMLNIWKQYFCLIHSQRYLCIISILIFLNVVFHNLKFATSGMKISIELCRLQNITFPFFEKHCKYLSIVIKHSNKKLPKKGWLKGISEQKGWINCS